MNMPKTPTVTPPFSRRPVTAEARVHSQANLCGICVEQNSSIIPPMPSPALYKINNSQRQ